MEEIDIARGHRALVDVIRADPRRPHRALILRNQIISLVPCVWSLGPIQSLQHEGFMPDRTPLTCSGSRRISSSSPIRSTSVRGMARDKTCFRDGTFSYRSDTSSSFCKSLSEEESWSEMVVRDLAPLLRCHSLVMLGSA